MARVLVTGGCGFVGRHLVNALADRGDQVTVLDLGKALEAGPWRDDITLRPVDLRDAKATAAAMAEHERVFHNASLVHTKQNRGEDVWAVNFGGTKHVVAGCREHGIAKLVYVSSASVVYEGRDIRGGDESLPYARESQAPYADSKIAAEKFVLGASDATLATCAIRPHVVFGPGDTRLLPAILERARAGKLKFAVGPGTHLSDFTYIDNLTDALLAASERLEAGGPLAGQALFITNGEPMGFFEFVGRVLTRLDMPRPTKRVPFAVAYAAATLAETWDTLVKGGTLHAEDGMSRFAIRYLCTDHYFSIAKAKAALDWSPKVSIDEGIERTIRAL